MATRLQMRMEWSAYARLGMAREQMHVCLAATQLLGGLVLCTARQESMKESACRVLMGQDLIWLRATVRCVRRAKRVLEACALLVTLGKRLLSTAASARRAHQASSHRQSKQLARTVYLAMQPMLATASSVMLAKRLLRTEVHARCVLLGRNQHRSKQLAKTAYLAMRQMSATASSVMKA